MKIITNTLMLLVICFTLNCKTCDGQILEALKIIGNAIDLDEKIEKVLDLVIERKDEAAIDAKKKDEKLNEISSRIDQSEKNLQNSFKKVLTKIDDIANNTVSSLIAINLETTTSRMREELGNIILYAQDAKNGSLANSSRIIGKLDSFSNNVRNYKTELKVIFQRKLHSLDFLEYVKTKSYNVCNHKMSQLQMLDIFRSLYVEHIIRYALAELLIISIHDKLGSPDKDNHGKRLLYKEVQADFNTGLVSFQNIMLNASREFETCNEPKVSYKSGWVYYPGSCYVIHPPAKNISEPSNFYQPPTGTITALQPKMKSIFPYCWYYFSLRPANAKPGYVVVGAKIERHENILYIKVLQAKLLPSGLVDSKTVCYNNDTKPGIGESVVKIHFGVLDRSGQTSINRSTIIDLTETVASGDRVVTGLRFAKSKLGHVYLEVSSTAINLRKGLLYENTTRPEEHKDGSESYDVRIFHNTNHTVDRLSTGLQRVKPNQQLVLYAHGPKGAKPFVDGDVIFPTPLTLLSGVSLYVKELEGPEAFLSLKMHTFDIVPHIGVNVDVNQNSTDILEAL